MCPIDFCLSFPQLDLVRPEIVNSGLFVVLTDDDNMVPVIEMALRDMFSAIK
jgi:hypothetical protein